VKGILVNIFGGIMRCDIIAEGVIAAVKEVGLGVPLVVRLEGTNVELGKRILNESGLSVIAADNLADAAQKIVKAVKVTPFAGPTEFEFDHPRSNLSGGVAIGGPYEGGCTMKSPTAPKQSTVNAAREVLRNYAGREPQLWIPEGYRESGWIAPGHGKLIYVIFSGGEGNSGDGRGTGLSAGLRDE
jgi:hypothetical protein